MTDSERDLAASSGGAPSSAGASGSDIDASRDLETLSANIDALRAGDRVGEYVLDEPIGEGGCGRVWRARHAVLPGKIVALKMPRDPELIETLRRESLLQYGLEHEGILKILGVDLDAPIPYLAQEYAEGGDLATLIRGEAPLPVSRAVELFGSIVEIVARAHSLGIVHRDLKPGNILLNAEGKLLIGDFGLGRGVQETSESALRARIETFDGADPGISGTWEYMAPEQRDPKEAVEAATDPRIDVFALGIILYELLTGERPAGRVDLGHISRPLDAIFARCYTSRTKRFRNAVELQRVLSTLPGVPRSQGAKPIPVRRPRSRIKLLAYVLPIALAGVAYGILQWASEPSAELARDYGIGASVEARRLSEIRRRLETEPVSLQEAQNAFGRFQTRSRDVELLAIARRWAAALPREGATQRYRLSWLKYRLHRDAYLKAQYSILEPGRPDVYLRVFRTRDGKTTRLFDTSPHAVESWSHTFPMTGPPSFDFEWRPGDTFAVELWDKDQFGDNRLAKYEYGGELALLLLSSVQTSKDGHVVELKTNFTLSD
ncbi:MAG: serine/threonine-protein kinase [Planctomycetota bacterium]